MGVDLTLLPYRWPDLGGTMLAVTRLPLDVRNYGLWEVLSRESIPLDRSIQNYEDEGLETRTTDPYGEPLTYMLAVHLSRHLANLDHLSDWDQAIVAFIATLKSDRKIVLWFH